MNIYLPNWTMINEIDILHESQAAILPAILVKRP
jgi:hypothetical protein